MLKNIISGIPMVINHNSLPVDGAYIVLGKFVKNSNVFSLSVSSNLREGKKFVYYFEKIKNLNYKKIYVAKNPIKVLELQLMIN